MHHVLRLLFAFGNNHSRTCENSKQSDTACCYYAEATFLVSLALVSAGRVGTIGLTFAAFFTLVTAFVRSRGCGCNDGEYLFRHVAGFVSSHHFHRVGACFRCGKLVAADCDLFAVDRYGIRDCNFVAC